MRWNFATSYRYWVAVTSLTDVTFASWLPKTANFFDFRSTRQSSEKRQKTKFRGYSSNLLSAKNWTKFLNLQIFPVIAVIWPANAKTHFERQQYHVFSMDNRCNTCQLELEHNYKIWRYLLTGFMTISQDLHLQRWLTCSEFASNLNTFPSLKSCTLLS